eukprot:GHVQ01011036.1.p2 GENE.GHVQ01011036.1~~GHVQ01011036.1.p2  ORF type:complete len:266 (+),score=41.98 GHVQ01011036.1:1281-2078(+)
MENAIKPQSHVMRSKRGVLVTTSAVRASALVVVSVVSVLVVNAMRTVSAAQNHVSTVAAVGLEEGVAVSEISAAAGDVQKASVKTLARNRRVRVKKTKNAASIGYVGRSETQGESNVALKEVPYAKKMINAVVMFAVRLDLIWKEFATTLPPSAKPPLNYARWTVSAAPGDATDGHLAAAIAQARGAGKTRSVAALRAKMGNVVRKLAQNVVRVNAATESAGLMENVHRNRHQPVLLRALSVAKVLGAAVTGPVSADHVVCRQEL